MSVSSTSFSSNDLDNVEYTSSTPEGTEPTISLWNWRLEEEEEDDEDLRFSPLATSSSLFSPLENTSFDNLHRLVRAEDINDENIRPNIDGSNSSDSSSRNNNNNNNNSSSSHPNNQTAFIRNLVDRRRNSLASAAAAAAAAAYTRSQQRQNEPIAAVAAVGLAAAAAVATVAANTQHQSAGMLSAPPAIINFLDTTEIADARHRRHSHQSSRVIIVDHERGIQTNQNLFFDFFGGGDSSEAILEYYRSDMAKVTNQRLAKFFLDPVSPDTQLVVPSTLSLVAKWANLFNPDDSYETAFHTREDGCDDTNICLMINLQTVPYFKDEENNLEAIAVPFADPNLFLYFVIPTKMVNLQHFVANPNKNILKNIIESTQPRKVKYHIPKMMLESHVDEMALFKQNGINNLTQDEIADGLTLTNLEQVVEIELNEEGVGGCMVDEARKSPSVEHVNDPEAVEFIVDKPYIFFVYHKAAKTFLYYGVIFKPLGYEA